MTGHITIDYEKLVADYVQSLTTVLRGFSSGAGHAFLDMWVYDEDDTKSILGILEEARDAGVPAITLLLGAATLKKLDTTKLKELAARFGSVGAEQRGSALEFCVSFDKAKSRIGVHAGTKLRFGARAARSKAELAAVPTRTQYDIGTINPLYAEALKRMAQSHAAEAVLGEEAGLVLAQAAHNGVTLMALIEPTRHIVKKAAYQGAATEMQRGLLESLCRLMVGKPVLECGDHAVVFLEFELRDHSKPRPVPGIVTPENSDAMFALPTALARGVVADYRKKTGFRRIENTYDQPISNAWRVLSQEERARQIQRELEQSPLGDGLHLERLETPKRVVVGFREDIGSADKQERLLKLEDHLKRVLEPTLQLYVEPKPDANKIRRLKEGNGQ
jgi:hypothetical protein